MFAKGPSIKDVGIFPPIFDPYPPHAATICISRTPPYKRGRQIGDLTPSFTFMYVFLLDKVKKFSTLVISKKYKFSFSST